MAPGAARAKDVASEACEPLPLVRTGDAFDLIDRLPTDSVDLLLTSPPYWGLRTYGHDHDEQVLQSWREHSKVATEGPPYAWYRDHGGVLGLEPYPQWYVAHLTEFFLAARRVLKPGGSVWLNLGDTYFARWSSIRADARRGIGDSSRTRRRTPTGGMLHDKQLLLMPSRVAIALQDDGWILRNDLIWNKTNVAPRQEKDRLRHSHEHLFHFVQRRTDGRPRYWYDPDAVEPGARDVIDCANGRNRDGHSATFPAALIRPRILSSCPPGGLVFDPFCGTGRALEVAVECGRRAHGFELNPAYAASARANVKAARAKVAAALPFSS
jgi:site-specific DNA-methyltransferase (cytosine-N4-specific)